MELEEMIVKRKSVRKYGMNPLSEDVLRLLGDSVKKTESPFGGKFGFRIIGKSEYDAVTGGRFKIAAPHYLMFYGSGTDDVLRSIGFAGELAALRLAEMDIGTCWLGGATSKDKLDGEDYVICIAFGEPAEEFRKAASEAKRKKLGDIAEGYSAEQTALLENVRLAPSAVNLQPWYFKCEGNRIHVFRRRTLISGIAHLKTMQKIDIGIAVSHFPPQSFTVEYVTQKRKGCDYECTLVF